MRLNIIHPDGTGEHRSKILFVTLERNGTDGQGRAALQKTDFSSRVRGPVVAECSLAQVNAHLSALGPGSAESFSCLR